MAGLKASSMADTDGRHQVCNVSDANDTALDLEAITEENPENFSTPGRMDWRLLSTAWHRSRRGSPSSEIVLPSIR
jgi:hypothetical protein